MRENPGLSQKLSAVVDGEVLADAASRGRYATDASIYQMVPEVVVVPHSVQDVQAVMDVAREAEVPILPRGGGTSQCGQTVNRAVVLDNTRHLNSILDIDADAMTARVEPGLVLDELNRALKPHGLWFPVDPSTASRCTLGGMAANNSSGGKSLRYGIMLLCMAFFGLLVWVGLDFLDLGRTERSPVLGIRKDYIYWAMPVGMTLMIVNSLVLIAETLSLGRDIRFAADHAPED